MSVVETEREAPIRWVHFDSGPRNVMDPASVEALRRALAFDEEAPVVVLRGRQDGFCSGLDNAVLAGPAPAREQLLASMGSLLVEILRGGTRVVSLLEGHAVAAGAMLLLVSDVRIGLPGRARIGFSEPRVGMPLPELPALLARERLDRRALHEATALGRLFDPEAAARVGFLDAIVPDEAALIAEARRQAEDLSQLTRTAYEGSLRSMWSRTLARLEELAAAQRRRADRARSEGD